MDTNNISESDMESLYKWIDDHEISRPKKNINRDFSDAVPLAEILKSHYAKLVDLHNYAPKNSVAKKLGNWELLNRKVLTRINMGLSASVMQNLAEGTAGVIEKVLFEMKEKIETQEAKEKLKADLTRIETLSPEISGTVVHVKDKDGKSVTEHKIIPLQDFEKMEQELCEKNEAIQIFRNKVQHLEKLLALKDDRIKDLESQIENITNNPISSTAQNLLHKIF